MVTDIADPAFVIVGNKVDLEASRAVETHEAKQYANDLGAKYFETSAVIPLNINELFVGISTCPFEKPRKQDTARAVSAPVVREITISQAIDSRPAAGCAC
jgi:GTPase SAR1 family protein